MPGADREADSGPDPDADCQVTREVSDHGSKRRANHCVFNHAVQMLSLQWWRKAARPEVVHVVTTVSEATKALRRFAGASLATLVVFGNGACGGSDSSGPEDESGELDVTTSTRGLRLDPDGYAIIVDDGAPLAIGTSGTVTVSDLPTGPLGVELSDRASNCSVEGDNPRVVAIDAGAVARTTFQLVCGELSRAALRFNGTTYAFAADASSFDLTDRWTIEA